MRYGDPVVQMLRNRNLHKNQRVARFANIEASPRLELEQLNAAATLDFLASPPGNRLEVLKRAHKANVIFVSTTSFAFALFGRHKVPLMSRFRLRAVEGAFFYFLVDEPIPVAAH